MLWSFFGKHTCHLGDFRELHRTTSTCRIIYSLSGYGSFCPAYIHCPGLFNVLFFKYLRGDEASCLPSRRGPTAPAPPGTASGVWTEGSGRKSQTPDTRVSQSPNRPRSLPPAAERGREKERGRERGTEHNSDTRCKQKD